MILDAKVDENILSVTHERHRAKFQARMAVDPKAQQSMLMEVPGKPPLDSTTLSSPAALQAPKEEPRAIRLSRAITEAEATKITSDYNFIVLVDRSGSMQSLAGRTAACASATCRQWSVACKRGLTDRLQ